MADLDFPVSPREPERLAALHALGILDTAPAPEFGAIVALAARVLGAPTVLISLVDRDRLWFKARCGFDGDEVPRPVAFCNHVLLSEEVMVVEDAVRDPRFSANPLVVQPGGIRFYAGAPLVMEPGLSIGTLCLIGPTPRALAPAEIETLRSMAAVVVGLVRGHATAQEALRLAREVEVEAQARERQRRALELATWRFRQTEALAAVGGWELDLATQGVVWSDEVYRICDVPPGTLVDLALAASVYPDAERERLKILLDRCVETGLGFDEEFEIVTLAGQRKHVRAVCEREVIEGRTTRLFGIFQDVSERRRSEARLWRAANVDALTGLANRHRFLALLGEAAAGPKERHRAGLLMIDADGLKPVNDTLGHAAGDVLIRTIASRIAAVVGEAGVAARLGGDEFAVLLPGEGRRGALAALARRILKAMGRPFDHEGQSITPAVSIGGATCGRGGGLDALRQNADLALYHAKEAARGGYVAFSPKLGTAITQRLRLVTELGAALDAGDVLPWYQPIVDVRTGRLTGVEALARMRRGPRILSAGAFAPALEDRRNALRLTATMVRSIVADILAWAKAGIYIPRVGINVGLHDFAQGDIEADIIGAFGKAGLPLSQVVIEVTETVFLGHGGSAVAGALSRLRERGALVALDDFGTGYASLSHLGTFPVDIIKMDRSFVSRMSDGGAGEVIATALVNLAHRLGIAVVAEGVETLAQLEHLSMLGCDRAQGYVLARPMPARDIETFVGAFGTSRAGPREPAKRAG